jgi:hypothetical protein
MPKPTSRDFAYSTGAAPLGSTKVGNIIIGKPTNGFVGTGLKWWGGPDEDQGYVIAKSSLTPNWVTSVNRPSIDSNIGFSRSLVKAEKSFLDIVNNNYNQSLTSGSYAKNYLESNGYWSSFGGVVTNGLILYSDAGNPNSYPGIGTTWTDLSGNGKNGGLINGVGYKSENGGSLSFDGVNDVVSYGTGNTFFPLPQFTISIWFRSFGTTPTTGTSPSLFGFTYGIRCQVNDTSISYGVDNGVDLNLMSTVGNIPFRNGNWYNATFYHTGTSTGIYINGVFNNSISRNWSGSTRWPTNSWNLGRDNNDAMYYFRGDIGTYMMYNRVLSADEILQNYNSTKGRFEPNGTTFDGTVMDGLVFRLDAGDINSYPGSGTSAYNLSGNNILTLANTLGYRQESGGYFLSDGTDDGLTTPDSNNLDISNNFTLESWVWFNQHKNYGSLLVKGPGGNGPLFNYCFFFYATNIVCGFGDGTTFYASGILPPPINTWHHIVGVYDSVAINFYLNGVLIQSIPTVATPYQNTNPLNVIQTEYPIDGRVSIARVYNRALTSTEIKQNYNATKWRYGRNPYENLTYSFSSNLTVTNNGTDKVSIFKTSGTFSWDTQAYSLTPFTAPCTIEFNKQAESYDNGLSYAMIGWNADPLTNASYDSIDYASYPFRSDNYQVYHNASQAHASGSWSTTDKFYVVYSTDGTIKHYNGSTLLYSVYYGTGNVVYVDSSFYSPSSTFGGFSNIRVIRYEWDGTSY